MADHDSLAARMYPAESAAAGAPQPAQASTATATAPDANGAPAPAQAAIAHTPPSAAPASEGPASPSPAPDAPTLNAQVEELVGREPSLAERMYSNDGPTLDVAQASAVLDVTFRIPTDDPADAEALREGQRVAADLVAELSVPRDAAREISGVLGDWHGKFTTGYVMDDGTLDSTGDRAEAELRAEWGKDFDAKVALAKRTAAHAIQRAPWLRDLLAKTPAGNDPKLIRHFAEIGLRQARAARRKIG